MVKIALKPQCLAAVLSLAIVIGANAQTVPSPNADLNPQSKDEVGVMQGTGPLEGAGPLQGAGPRQGAAPIQAAAPLALPDGRGIALLPPTANLPAVPALATVEAGTIEQLLASLLSGADMPTPQLLTMLVSGLPPRSALPLLTALAPVSTPADSEPPPLVLLPTVLPPPTYDPTKHTQISPS